MDRTREFFEYLRDTNVPLTPQLNKRRPISHQQKNATEFYSATKEINLRLQTAVTYVAQLDELVNGDNVLNENDPKIQQLINQLQVELKYINNSINTLEQQTKSNEAVHSITESLRRSLASVTKDFQTAVQSSAEKMKKVQERRQHAGYVPPRTTSYDTIYNQEDDEVEIRSNQLAQVELEQLNQRLDTVHGLEQQTSNIYKMFTDLFEMIAAKDYDIVRIDENLQDALDNLTEGQKQMEKYYEKVKNNKWFILKIFAVLFVFAMIFILII